MSQFFEKVKVVLGAVPTWGAAATSAITGVSSAVVPVLPVHWGVKVAAVAAGAVGFVAAVVKTVARVTPIVDAAPSLLRDVDADFKSVIESWGEEV